MKRFKNNKTSLPIYLNAIDNWEVSYKSESSLPKFRLLKWSKRIKPIKIQ